MNRQRDHALGQDQVLHGGAAIDRRSVASTQRCRRIRRRMFGDCLHERLLLHFAQRLPISATAALGESAATEPRSALAIAHIARFAALRAHDLGVLQRRRGRQHDLVFFVQAHHHLHGRVVDARHIFAEFAAAQHHRRPIDRAEHVESDIAHWLAVIIQSRCEGAVGISRAGEEPTPAAEPRLGALATFRARVARPAVQRHFAHAYKALVDLRGIEHPLDFAENRPPVFFVGLDLV